MTGRKPTEAEVDNMIDTGESETIFQKAILEQGRGHVSLSSARLSGVISASGAHLPSAELCVDLDCCCR